jgi:hypothetical protein
VNPTAAKLRRGVALSLIGVATACGGVTLRDRSPTSFPRAPTDSYTLEAEVTSSGVSDLTVHAVTSDGMFPISGTGSSWGGRVFASRCTDALRYRYRADYLDSNRASVTRYFPASGEFVARITGEVHPDCAGRFGRTFEVTSTEDLPDVNPGDGMCAAVNQSCTLRAAVMQSNASPGHDLIHVHPGRYRLTSSEFPDGFDASVGDLDLLDHVTIRGEVADVVIDGGLVSRIFHVGSRADVPVQVELDHLTLTRGATREFGGAIRNHGSLRIQRSTHHEGTTVLHYVTIARNGNLRSAIMSVRGQVVMVGSIAIDNQANDCFGEVWSWGYNVVESPDFACRMTPTPTDVFGGRTLEVSLLRMNARAPDGGPGDTHALTTTRSAALDEGPRVVGDAFPDCPRSDQRGLPRPVQATAAEPRCDRGAYERQPGE